MTRLLFISTVFLLLTACSNNADKKSAADNSVDTTKSFKVANYWLTPKKSFDFNSLGKSSGDTLHIVTCDQYVYFPFGKLTDKSLLKTSLLKDFTITKFKLDTFTNAMLPSDPSDDFKEWSESLELELGENKLSLYLDNDPEASTHGYIKGGHIVDSKVIFADKIKIGISAEDFYKTFFDYFPTKLLTKYKVVEFESCVTDVTHIYTFDNGQLSMVKFK